MSIIVNHEPLFRLFLLEFLFFIDKTAGLCILIIMAALLGFIATTVLSISHSLDPFNIAFNPFLLIFLNLVRNISIIVEYVLFGFLLYQVLLTHYLLVQIARSQHLLVHIVRIDHWLAHIVRCQ